MEEKIDVSDLRGMLVVAYEEGLQLGKVFDVYFDKQTKKIIGISYKAGGLGFKKESFVYSDDIKKLGQDVIILSGETKAQPLPETLSESGLKAMKDFTVTTDDGAHIGQLTDLNVGEDDWKISELILDKKKYLKVEGNDIVLGDDTLIVPADYTSRIKEMDTEKTGIMRHMTDTAYLSETVKETVHKVGETVKKTTEKVGGAAKETVGKVGDTIEGVLKRGGPGAETEETEPEKNEAETEKIDPEERTDNKKPDE